MAVTVIIPLPAATAVEIAYDAGERRNPFVPPQGENNIEKAKVSDEFFLEGIIYDPAGNSMAIIGGQTYKVGETVGENKILEIRKNRVVIETGTETRTLWIGTDEQVPDSNGGAKES